jgi:hypothetical protein
MYQKWLWVVFGHERKELWAVTAVHRNVAGGRLTMPKGCRLARMADR